MKSERPRVTSADVAREAGVSRATVSYVLNEVAGQHISATTRERVRETAARLGYQPHAGARALRRGRSDVVLIAVPGITLGPGLSPLLLDLSAALTARGLICATDIGRTTGDTAAARAWLRMQPLAVITLGLAPTAPARRLLRQTGVHLIDPFGASGPGATAEAFAQAQQSVGRVQAEHLIAHGHQRLAYATTTAPSLMPMAGLRLAGVRAACAEAGLVEPDVRPMPALAGDAVAAVAGWTRGRQRPTAVAAYNDETAITVLTALHALGVRVPEDVALIGVDDIPMAAAVTPPLTTLTWPTEWFAREIADLVVALAEETPSPTPVGVEHRGHEAVVVSRGSV